MEGIKPLSRSQKKFVRLEKGRIRAQFSDGKKRDEMIGQMYATLLHKPGAVAAEVKPVAKPVEKVKTQKPAAKKKAAVKK